MRRHHLLTLACSLCLLLAATSAHAQVVRAGVGILGKLGRWIDTTTGKDLDSTYIGVPEYPWQFIAQGFTTQSDLHMKSTFPGGDMYQGVVGNVTLEPCIRTAVSTSAGFWVGYRGWGLGYSTSIAGDEGDDWDFELSSDNYFVRLRLHNFEGADFKSRLNMLVENPDEPDKPVPYDILQPLSLSSPVKIKTQLADGVYIFNSSRFSYAAAYDQSLVQLRSAGSFVAGARYFHSNYSYAHDSNADIILHMNDIGRIRTWQVSIGAGYAYNWVPAEGWLLSLLAMPMVTAYNHIKTDTYDSNYRQMALDDVFHSDDELPREDYRITPMGTESHNSRIQLNVNSRASLSYSWSRWFFNINGNFYHSRYRYHQNSGWLNDWNVNANIGIRF